MTVGTDPRPIFVVGSPRSGTSILTWSIGQHPNILALEETGWMGPIALSLAVAHATGASRGDRSQLSAMGVTRDAMMETFGGAIDQLVIGHRQRFEELALNAGLSDARQVDDTIRVSRSADEPKARWVDGTPENSFYVYELALLFPKAQFIHLVRDPRSVARSLVHFHTIGGARYTVDAAYREWLRNVRECHSAERALGSQRVLRIHYKDLIERSQQSVSGILGFLGESYSELCVAALSTRINSSVIPNGADLEDPDSALVAEADAMAVLLLDPTKRYDPDVRELAELEDRFQRRSFGLGLSPSQRTLMRRSMPRDAVVLVAARGDDALLELEGRTGWHFPQNEPAGLAGLDPISDDGLIQELERLRALGAQFLLIPAGAGDALRSRVGVIEHLRKWYPLVGTQQGVGDVWGLAVAGAGPPSAAQDREVIDS